MLLQQGRGAGLCRHRQVASAGALELWPCLHTLGQQTAPWECSGGAGKGPGVRAKPTPCLGWGLPHYTTLRTPVARQPWSTSSQSHAFQTESDLGRVSDPCLLISKLPSPRASPIPAVCYCPLLPLALAWPWQVAQVVEAKRGMAGSSNRSPLRVLPAQPSWYKSIVPEACGDPALWPLSTYNSVPPWRQLARTGKDNFQGLAV